MNRGKIAALKSYIEKCESMKKVNGKSQDNFWWYSHAIESCEKRLLELNNLS